MPRHRHLGHLQPPTTSQEILDRWEDVKVCDAGVDTVIGTWDTLRLTNLDGVMDRDARAESGDVFSRRIFVEHMQIGGTSHSAFLRLWTSSTSALNFKNVISVPVGFNSQMVCFDYLVTGRLFQLTCFNPYGTPLELSIAIFAQGDS